jgi:hypothetical protein
MVSIKLQRCGHHGYHNPDEIQARVQSLFALCAVHAYVRVFKTYVQFLNYYVYLLVYMIDL